MKKNFKTFLALLVVLCLSMAVLTGCGGEDKPSETINVGTLKGPTGMGMVKLMEDKESYKINQFEAPTEVTAKLINGELDVATVPSNLAAVLFNKTGGNVVTVATNTLGVLYLTENGSETVADLKALEDRAIFASGKGGTPEYVLKALCEKAGVDYDGLNIKWLANHSDVLASHMKAKGSVALLPEPFVTVATAKNPNVKVVMDLNKAWKEALGEDLPMGVLVATKDFVSNRSEDLEFFMRDYDASVRFVNENPEEASQLIADNKIVPEAKIAEKAIPKCNIVFVAGEEGKAMVDKFFDTVFKLDPKSVGGKLPGEDYFYIGK